MVAKGPKDPLGFSEFYRLLQRAQEIKGNQKHFNMEDMEELCPLGSCST